MSATLHTKSAGGTPEVPARWYSVSRIGAATLCIDERDARNTAKQSDRQWPNGAPHRAVLMGNVATEPAPDDTAKLLRASVEMERLRRVLAAAKHLVDRDLRYSSGLLDAGLIKREEVLALRDAIASAEEPRAALSKAQGGAA